MIDDVERASRDQFIDFKEMMDALLDSKKYSPIQINPQYIQTFDEQFNQAELELKAPPKNTTFPEGFRKLFNLKGGKNQPELIDEREKQRLDNRPEV